MTEQVKELLGLKKETREEFLARRRSFIGASDVAHVVGAGDFACARRLAYEKIGIPSDFDSSDKPEFRRGHRLEPVAAAYYAEKTGRRIKETSTIHAPGKPHLAVSIDRLVWRENDDKPGILELKVLGKFSMELVKKSGLYESYIAQVNYGMGVAGLSWGSFGIYGPETDELLYWDFSFDRELSEKLMEDADDFWSCHVKTKILPPPLPEIKNVCIGCDYRIKCRGQSDLSAFKEKKPRKKK